MSRQEKGKKRPQRPSKRSTLDPAGELRVPPLAIGLIGAGTLLLEILLTRIFSLTMWYHFAFVAISLALFGIAASGAVVTVWRSFFAPERALSHMAAAAAAMGVTTVVSFLIDLQIPFIPFDAEGYTVAPYFWFTAKFLVLALPFFASGLVIALAFTHAPAGVHRTYFADLVGGGIGCFLVVPVLLTFSGPTAILLTAALPLASSALFYRAAGNGKPARFVAAAAAGVVALVAVNTATDTIRITKIKAYKRDVGQVVEGPLLYERWHPVSRVAVHPETEHYGYAGWFHGSTIKEQIASMPRLMPMTNDGGARTFLFPELPQEALADIFRNDVSDLVYAVTDRPDVLVVGVGGGKDVLSALALGAGSVTGVELNPIMIEAVQERFADYTGAPFDDPRVTIVINEGRNYIASNDRKYDVIKISVTDTWTASAMGAYALNENYLYTLEAMREFIGRLKPGGYLSIVRWYPQESLRLAVLASTALATDEPYRQIAMARSRVTTNLIVKNGSFTPDEVGALQARVDEAGLVWIGGGQEKPEPQGQAPGAAVDFLHRVAAWNPDLPQIAATVPFSVAPSTDDRPFFFSPVSLREAARGQHEQFGSFTFQHGRALDLLWGLMQISLGVAVVFVVGPLLLRGREHLSRDLATNGYFLALGFGYLLIEIPLLQQFILFLGHPTYAVTVVLFSLLVSSGIGSLLAQRIPERALGFLLPVALVVLLTVIALLPTVLSALIGLPIAARVAVTVGVIGSLGLVLGMPFPVGLRELHRSAPSGVPWAWAVNGAASVGAPVLAMILAIVSGFSTALYAGAACYAVAIPMLARLRSQPDVSVDAPVAEPEPVTPALPRRASR